MRLLCFSALLFGLFVGITPATADELTDAIQATYKVTNVDSTATCFLVTREKQDSDPETILVTAAHVLERASGDTVRIVKRERRTDGTYQRTEVPIKIRDGKRDLWKKHPDHDIAAMKVELDDRDAYHSFKFDQIADSALVTDGQIKPGSEVWILCYPAQLESSTAGFSILRRGTIASYPISPPAQFKTMLIDFSTFGGDSGGPVVLPTKEQFKVIGLVLGQHRQTTKSVTSNEERTVHRSMGLSIVVHAAFIRETIERL